MKNRIILLGLVVILALGGGIYAKFIRPITFKQDIDVTPIALMKFEAPINTIEGMPFDDIAALGGYNFIAETQRRDDIKDRANIVDKGGALSDSNMAYFTLYYTPEQALKAYNFKKSSARSRYGIEYNKKNNKYDQYFATKILQERSIEHLNAPVDRFMSKVVFLKQNLVIEFFETNNTPDTIGKEKFIRTIAGYLQEHIAKNGKENKD